jgi:hypothetical protein
MKNQCNNSNRHIKAMIFIKKSDCKIENGNLKIKRKYGKNKREIINYEYRPSKTTN